MLIHCWATIYNAGPTFHHLVTILFLWWYSLWPDPMAHSYRLGRVIWWYQVRIPVGQDICHRGCAYTVLQTVQRPGVYSAAYGTVHYKEPLKSFEIRVGHNPGFGLPSVAILPWFSRKRRKTIFIYDALFLCHHALNMMLNAGQVGMSSDDR